MTNCSGLDKAMLTLFWIAAGFLAYTFVGYPVLMAVVGMLRRRPVRRAPVTPPITIIIPAHNEEARIAAKLEQTLALDYPAELRQIIVASDGSTDGTNAIVSEFTDRGVELLALAERNGKHHAQMLAFERARGEVIVFTDSSVGLDPGALRQIVSNFADPTIGCVSSEDHVTVPGRRWMGERVYVELEMRLRRLEARAGSLVGLSGSFCAARREVCAPWNPHQSSDFFLPLNAASRGLRAVVDPECRGHYGLVRSERAELSRKVRTIVHGIDVLFSHVGLLNPFRTGFYSVQLISHKLFRWLLPFGALALFVASVFLWNAGPFYQVALVAQVAAYGSGLLALVFGGSEQFKLLRLAGFFLLGNAATVLAWMHFLRGEKFVAWEPSRRG
jgi:glycosyltransferase involved in cell wall biosynthesis